VQLGDYILPAEQHVMYRLSFEVEKCVFVENHMALRVLFFSRVKGGESRHAGHGCRFLSRTQHVSYRFYVLDTYTNAKHGFVRV
jgi:hypothetical protein